MSPQSSPDDAVLTQTHTVCKVIAGALVFGVVTFAAVAIALRLGEPPGGGFVSFVAVGFAAVAAVVRQLVLGVISGRSGESSHRATGIAASLALFQTRMIVGLAILESAAFFNIIAYLIEGRWWSLLIVAALVAWMLAAFPTRTRLRQWVKDREQLKTFGPGMGE